MTTDEHSRIARQIVAAIQNRERFRPLRGADRPESLDAAYRIQDQVYALLQSEAGFGPVGGHKIALTSRAIQEMCGVDQPVGGSIFAKTIHRSPATVRLSDFVHLGVEFEVAFEMARDVPAAGAPYDMESIAAYAGACMPAFELIEDRHADYADLDAASILTDRCWCGGIVLGEPVTDWRGLDLAAAATQLRYNGEIIDRAVAGDALGHPLAGLAWVANHLIARGAMLRQGEIVMTGSALRTRFPEAGDRIDYTVDGLGTVSVCLEN